MTLQKLTRNLTLWVLLAIVAGALLGHFEPATAVKWSFLGKRFIDVVKLFINPIIFLTITLGISTMGDLKEGGPHWGQGLAVL
jgi:aerobic C4-dicarboxylate transport protein